MKTPSLEKIVATVASVAARENMTPHALRKYFEDVDENPDLYGSDLDRERAEVELLGSEVSSDFITKKVCAMAELWEKESMRDMVRRWQRDAAERGLPVLYILENDPELGWEAHLNRVATESSAPAPGPVQRKSTTRTAAGPEVLFGVPTADIAAWMAARDRTAADVAKVMDYYGRNVPTAPGTARDLDDVVIAKIEEALE